MPSAGRWRLFHRGNRAAEIDMGQPAQSRTRGICPGSGQVHRARTQPGRFTSQARRRLRGAGVDGWRAIFAARPYRRNPLVSNTKRSSSRSRLQPNMPEYIDRQKDEIGRAASFEHLALPRNMDYSEVAALSFEVRQQLQRHQPETLGQASRISGVTPAAISLLLVHLRKRGGLKSFSMKLQDANEEQQPQPATHA